MRLAIVGTHDLTPAEYARAERTMTTYISGLPKSTVIVSGGARGVDELAATIAEKFGLETLIFKADWRKGNHAGMLRNAEIVDNSERLTAFWDGKSPGTRNSIERAIKAKIPVEVYSLDGGSMGPTQEPLF